MQDHHLLALWAAACAEHVLDIFESAQPEDPRPRQAIEHARAVGGHAMGAAHDLGAAAYAIKAARAAAPDGEGEAAGRRECQW